MGNKKARRLALLKLGLTKSQRKNRNFEEAFRIQNEQW